ncbi:hypothetical protein WA158_003714 [Blastocystis sp. Blastoise]
MTGKGNRLAHSDQGPAKSGKSYKFLNSDMNLDYVMNQHGLMNQNFAFNYQDTSFAYEGSNQILQQSFGLLSKKSDQSRQRGLKSILTEIETMSDDELLLAIPPFVYYYEQLYYSNDKQVRYCANSLLKTLGTHCPKGFKPYMTQLMPIWCLYMNDIFPFVSDEAKSAFDSIIPTASHTAVFTKYLDIIMKTASKYIDIPQTTLQKKCDTEDIITECRERLHITSLQYYITTLPTTIRSSSLPLSICALTFLNTLYSSISFSQLLEYVPQGLEGMIAFKKACRSILNSIGDCTDTSVQKHLIGTWMNLVIKWEDIWTYSNHDECINLLIKRLKNNQVDNSYLLEHMNLLLPLMKKIGVDTYKGEKVNFYTLLLTTLYAFLKANKEINIYYYVDFLYVFHLTLSLDMPLPATSVDLPISMFTKEDPPLFATLLNYLDNHGNNQQDETFKRIIDLLSSIYEDIIHNSAPTAKTILKTLISYIKNYTKYGPLYICLFIKLLETEAKDNIILSLHNYFEDIFNSPLMQNPRENPIENINYFFSILQQIMTLPKDIVVRILPDPSHPSSFLLPLLQLSIFQIENGNYNKDRVNYLFFPLLSLFPSCMALEPEEDCVSLLIQSIQSANIDSLYKLDLLVHALTITSFLPLLLSSSQLYTSINTFIQIIFTNGYILMNPKLSIYIDDVHCILKLAPLVSQYPSLPDLILNPILNSIDKYSLPDINKFFETVMDTLYKDRSTVNSTCVLNVWNKALLYIYNYNHPTKHHCSLPSLLHEYYIYTSHKTYHQDLYNLIYTYITTVEKAPKKEIVLQDKDILMFGYCMTIYDDEERHEISDHFINSQYLISTLQVKTHQQLILSNILSLYHFMIPPVSISLETQIITYVYSTAYDLKDLVSGYPNIMEAIQSINPDYIEILATIYELYVQTISSNNHEVLNTFISMYRTIFYRFCQSSIPAGEKNAYVSSITIDLCQSILTNTIISQQQWLSRFLYIVSKTLSSTCASQESIQTIRDDYFGAFNTFVEQHITDLQNNEYMVLSYLYILLSLFSNGVTITNNEIIHINAIDGYISNILQLNSPLCAQCTTRLLLSIFKIKNCPPISQQIYNYILPLAAKSLPLGINYCVKLYRFMKSSSLFVSYNEIATSLYINICSSLFSSIQSLEQELRESTILDDLLENPQNTIEKHVYLQDLIQATKFYKYIKETPAFDVSEFLITCISILFNPLYSPSSSLHPYLFCYVDWILHLQPSPVEDIAVADSLTKPFSLFLTQYNEYPYIIQLYGIILFSRLFLVLPASEDKINLFNKYSSLSSPIPMFISSIMPHIPFIHHSAKVKPKCPTLSLLDLLKPLSFTETSFTPIALYSIAQTFPTLLRSWWINLPANEQQTAQTIQFYIELYINSPLLSEEYRDLKEIVNTMNFEDISLSLYSKQIVCSIPVDDTSIQFTITVPSSYPLRIIEMDINSPNLISKVDLQRMKLQLLNYKDINMSLSSCISGFFRNVKNSVEGLEVCPICYCVIHPGTNTLPDQKCRQCVGCFHKYCLYKWFMTSGGNTCPLCRQLMILDNTK